MSQPKTDKDLLLLGRLLTFTFFFLICIGGDSEETDRNVLVELKAVIEEQSPVNRGSRYTKWNPTTGGSPCDWSGVSCLRGRVAGIDLAGDYLTGRMFQNFSALTELSSLDLSSNTIGGALPDDLLTEGMAAPLRFLNLSHNIFDGQLNFTTLVSLEVLDVSTNRFHGDIGSGLPGTCDRLVVANVSNNHITGEIGDAFRKCRNLEYIDLSYNNLTGDMFSGGFDRLKEVSLAENNMRGGLPGSIFSPNCSLQFLDLSGNHFSGLLPKEISNCKGLRIINLSANDFSGPIPAEIGSLFSLEGLYLGSNRFSSRIPETLPALPNLHSLDLSENGFRGEIQEIFGRFTQVKLLLLHGNHYSGGIVKSGITKLGNLSRLDLSYNNFSGPLPVEISRMASLTFLALSYNQFTGTIPSEYGNLNELQVLDLSSNRLNGSIPPTIGRLTSLLWLMLANNSLRGEIPRELGNCSSLLWFNLARNELSGPIPHELANIGSNPMPTFLLNRERDKITPGSGECLALRRWIPADYPPFSFLYPLLTRKNCRSLWDLLLKGVGIFPVCELGSTIRRYRITGYVQLCGNYLSGSIPSDIRKLRNFSMLHVGENDLSGELPPEIGRMPLIVLNATGNRFSGSIPSEIGNINCLENLDLSGNNFSGLFPSSLTKLSDLSNFNISYNPNIYGDVPATGQLATFDKWSFLGDPLLRLPFITNNKSFKLNPTQNPKRQPKTVTVLVVAGLFLALIVCGIMTIIVCFVIKSPMASSGWLLEDTKGGGTSDSSVKVIRLDKTSFTHSDILKATGSFSDDRIVGQGGFGTVYRGVLPDGREVAVKKLQREGVEGEREFRAEMEALSGNGFGWPHPNLVTLYGWCLDGSEKLLVYEFMEGGSLENFITDRTSMPWKKRLSIAIDVARALAFLHHECYPCIIHRDVKASNVLLDGAGQARVTDFGLARIMDVSKTHISTMVAGTIRYVAPEYGQTWQATTKGDVYSYGVLTMELAAARRAVEGGGDEECLLEWARRVVVDGLRESTGWASPPLVPGLADGAEEMHELLRIRILCTNEVPRLRPNMKEVLDMLLRISPCNSTTRHSSYSSASNSF